MSWTQRAIESVWWQAVGAFDAVVTLFFLVWGLDGGCGVCLCVRWERSPVRVCVEPDVNVRCLSFSNLVTFIYLLVWEKGTILGTCVEVRGQLAGINSKGSNSVSQQAPSLSLAPQFLRQSFTIFFLSLLMSTSSLWPPSSCLYQTLVGEHHHAWLLHVLGAGGPNTASCACAASTLSTEPSLSTVVSFCYF